MASRPVPLSALKVCAQLAKTSIRRLESAIECSENVLNTNMRLTAGEREHYRQAIACAKKEMLPLFRQLSEVKLPRAQPKTKKKIGRPSNAEIARNKAARQRER
jgi:hypothetical protein